MFRDLEFGHGRQAPWGPQTVVITQGAEADVAVAELTAQIALYTDQVIRAGGGPRGQTSGKVENELRGAPRAGTLPTRAALASNEYRLLSPMMS